MPLYEYHCEQCNCDFEHLKLSGSESDPLCPTCCGNQVKKLISSARARPNGIAAGKGGFKAPSCRPTGG